MKDEKKFLKPEAEIFEFSDIDTMGASGPETILDEVDGDGEDIKDH